MVQRALHWSHHAVGQVFKCLGIRDFSQGHSHGSPESLQVQIVLGQIVLKGRQWQCAVLDLFEKRMVKDPAPDGLGLDPKLFAETGHHHILS